MKKEFDLKIDGATLENIKIDSSNSLIVATYKRDVDEFKAGDILVDGLDPFSDGVISIFKGISSGNDGCGLFDVYVVVNANCGGAVEFNQTEWDYITNQRLAYEEEKKLLFDALKKEGLKWNVEKLEIEKLAPEFKRGDVLTSNSGDTILIFDKYTPRQTFSSFISNHARLINDNWSAPAFRYASIKEIEVFYKDLARMGKKWNAEKLELEELDISEIVVDYESAIEYLGIKDTLLVFKNCDRANKFNAQIKLQLIAEAWNKFDEFEADWESPDQYKYYPIFEVEDGKIEFTHIIPIRRTLDSHTSNFSFKTEERATQFGNQFIDLFKIALGF